ncbi:hypothetical protein VTL71DRAFT_3860 [Oculimacula yallundae]|uniref:Uncharacterized protein n=1 Tax=Oculimacula yallundae TaxID=86028 RepID=A0ABR4C4W7_9HELO
MLIDEAFSTTEMANGHKPPSTPFIPESRGKQELQRQVRPESRRSRRWDQATGLLYKWGWRWSNSYTNISRSKWPDIIRAAFSGSPTTFGRTSLSQLIIPFLQRALVSIWLIYSPCTHRCLASKSKNLRGGYHSNECAPKVGFLGSMAFLSDFLAVYKLKNPT